MAKRKNFALINKNVLFNKIKKKRFSLENTPFKVIDHENIKFKLPSATILSGPTSSGKTTLLYAIISFAKFLFKPIPAQILYCYSEFNEVIPKLQKIGVTIHHGVPSEDFLNKCKKPLLMILDDMMLHVSKQYIDLLFTVQSHHRNIGVMFVVQNLYDKNIKTGRDNAPYIILMNSPSSIRQIRQIGSNLFPGKTKEFMEIYKDATQKPYGYLVIDSHASTEEQLRLRTKILPNEYTQIYTP